MFQKNHTAFTLVELIVVITILAILATVGFLALQGYTKDAANTAVKTNLGTVLSAISLESSAGGNSPRKYIVHSTGATLSGAWYSGVQIVPGPYGTPDTNYSAGSADYAALKMDSSRFVDGSGSAFLVGAFDLSQTLPSGKTRISSFFQVAGVTGDGKWMVDGTYPAGSSGAVAGLLKDPASASLTGALVDSSSAPGSSGGAPVAYSLANSLRFDTSRTPHMSRVPVVAGNRKTWTWSGWVKRGKTGGYHAIFGGYTGLASGQTRATLFFALDKLELAFGRVQVSNDGYYNTTTTFTDSSEWKHIVVRFDSTQAVAANRAKLYVDGVLDSTFVAGLDVALNYDSGMGAAGTQYLGRYYDSFDLQPYYLDGYLSDVHFVSGQALDASAFGMVDPSTSAWVPKAYAGNYGTGGYRLDFSSAASVAALGTDVSGAGNHWTPAPGFAVTDQMADTPTNDFATLNPAFSLSPTAVSSNGNLQTVTGAGWALGKACTNAVSSGKWYWEVTPTAGTEWYVGIIDAATATDGQIGMTGWPISGYAYYQTASNYKTHAGVSTAYGSAYGIGSTIGVALDLSAGSLEFYKDGVSQGVAWASGISGSFLPAVSDGSGVGSSSATFNFGQGGQAGLSFFSDAGGYFKYAPPAGFKAISSKNLP